LTKRRAVEFGGYVMDIIQDRKEDWDESAYPYNLPAVRSWDTLELSDNVTFLVGENGSGKSTLIEAIAVAAGFNAEGGTKNFNFKTFDSHSNLSKHLRLVRTPIREKDGFFLRAESYFNVATNIEELDSEPSFGPPTIDSFGGKSLHKQSHGESFMALAQHRFGGKGLYILDEPEAALSPQRQLALLSRMHQLVEDNSQFVIATHSPILMAYPGAWIYQLDENGPHRIEWEETEHAKLTKQFMNRPEAFLNALFEKD